MASVLLEQVSKVYKGRQGLVRAVSGISVVVEDRDLAVLVGPSGCGKTTTLRMVAGLEEVTDGTIRIGDRVVNDVAPKDRDIAMVFQNYALYPHMTAYDNMAFGLKMRKTPRSVIRQRVEEVAELLGIAQLLKRKPAAMSGGERQRVAVGRAIVRHPKVFLFDEPLSNLDAKLRVQMRTEIKRIQRQLETTAIYVTHDQEEAMTLADQLVVMKGGVVQQNGTPMEIYNEPVNRFVAGFFGTPSMNFIAGTLTSDQSSLCFEGEGLKVRLPDACVRHAGGSRDLLLGIRAENVSVNGVARRAADAFVSCGQARVETVEPLGDSQIVHMQSTEQTRLVARIDPTGHVVRGDNVQVGIDAARVHLFAADEPGQRIVASGATAATS